MNQHQYLFQRLIPHLESEPVFISQILLAHHLSAVPLFETWDDHGKFFVFETQHLLFAPSGVFVGIHNLFGDLAGLPVHQDLFVGRDEVFFHLVCFLIRHTYFDLSIQKNRFHLIFHLVAEQFERSPQSLHTHTLRMDDKRFFTILRHIEKGLPIQCYLTRLTGETSRIGQTATRSICTFVPSGKETDSIFCMPELTTYIGTFALSRNAK